MNKTCAPPPEHAHHEWHWLRHESGGWFCAQWNGKSYALVAEYEIFQGGYCYVGPAILPEDACPSS